MKTASRNSKLSLLITLIICLGLFFRIINLDKKVYWHDEVHTSLRVAGYESEQLIAEIYSGEIITAQELLTYQQLTPEKSFSDAIEAFKKHPEHPPLYYILQRWWQFIFGS